MKIIHTADWHLGKLLCGVYLHEDQAFVLEEFYKLLQKEKPDLILLAGDIYDRSYPPVEAVRLLNDCFKKILLDLNIPMIIIAGNHDHSDRLDFGSELMEKSSLYLRAKLEKEIIPISFTDAFGEWEIYPIPYSEPAVVRSLYENPEIRSAEAAMACILEPINERIRRQKAAAKSQGQMPKRYLAVVHSFLVGRQSKPLNEQSGLSAETSGLNPDLPEESDSERPLSIGGVDYVRTELFAEFDYVALGHLHKPQKVERENIRYSGSLLKYSFSEANHQKSVVILDWQEELNIRLESLPVKRDLRVVCGKLAEIMERGRQDKHREDYIMAKLTDEEVLIDPISDLKGIYPNILAMEYGRDLGQLGGKGLPVGKDFTGKNIWDLFAEFYETATGQQPDLETLKQSGLNEGAENHEAD
ncbi:exonuclease SbcCD subunit D [Clostridiales bacterium COT073_COT-073]|nr:exonuclease SbcCD subunit D [Clostridiales bacterium COT073_COT-073]